MTASSKALPDPEEKEQVVEEMFDRIAGRYDRVNRIMTFRLDVGWRKRTVESLRLRPGDLVLDLACGTGDLCRDIAAAGGTAIGIDFSAGMLANARTAAPLVRASALELPVADGVADAVTRTVSVGVADGGTGMVSVGVCVGPGGVSVGVTVGVAVTVPVLVGGGGGPSF